MKSSAAGAVARLPPAVTAWAWLPALAAHTPAGQPLAAPSAPMALAAPRILNEPGALQALGLQRDRRAEAARELARGEQRRAAHESAAGGGCALDRFDADLSSV